MLVGDHRYEDRIDWIMGILTFLGAAVGVLLPVLFIVLGIRFYFPNLDLSILICQVTGVAMMIIGFAYFVCRKEV